LARGTLRANAAGLLLLLLLLMMMMMMTVATSRLVIRLRVVRPGSELRCGLGPVLLTAGGWVQQVVSGQ